MQPFRTVAFTLRIYVLQFFEPANNIRGKAMIAASAGIGVFPKRSGSVCHIAEKSDNIFEDILLKACPH